MKGKYLFVALLIVGAVGFLTGTVFSGEGDDQEAAPPPQAPPPPPELKALEPFVGQWGSSFEFLPAMFGQPGEGTGRGTSEWVLDNRFVLSRGRASSSFGDHEWIGLMTYDPMMKAYRSFSFDSHGMCDIATMAYDASSGTWTTLADGYDMNGKPAQSQATMRFVSRDKMEWEWSIKPEGGTEFVVMMKGTDSRMKPSK